MDSEHCLVNGQRYCLTDSKCYLGTSTWFKRIDIDEPWTQTDENGFAILNCTQQYEATAYFQLDELLIPVCETESDCSDEDQRSFWKKVLDLFW